MSTQVQAASRKERVCTARTLHLGFKVRAVRRWGVWRSHARGWWDAGYGLLQLIVPTGYLKMPCNGKAACTLEVSKCRLLFWDVG